MAVFIGSFLGAFVGNIAMRIMFAKYDKDGD